MTPPKGVRSNYGSCWHCFVDVHLLCPLSWTRTTWFTWRPTTSCWSPGSRSFRTRSIFLEAASSSRRSRSSTRISSVTWPPLTAHATWWDARSETFFFFFPLLISFHCVFLDFHITWLTLSVCHPVSERDFISRRGGDQWAAGRRQGAVLRSAVQHRHAGTSGRWPLYPPAHKVTAQHHNLLYQQLCLLHRSGMWH